MSNTSDVLNVKILPIKDCKNTITAALDKLLIGSNENHWVISSVLTPKKLALLEKTIRTKAFRIDCNVLSVRSDGENLCNADEYFFNGRMVIGLTLDDRSLIYSHQEKCF